MPVPAVVSCPVPDVVLVPAAVFCPVPDDVLVPAAVFWLVPAVVLLFVPAPSLPAGAAVCVVSLLVEEPCVSAEEVSQVDSRVLAEDSSTRFFLACVSAVSAEDSPVSAADSFVSACEASAEDSCVSALEASGRDSRVSGCEASGSVWSALVCAGAVCGMRVSCGCVEGLVSC
ncbi:MAG: hypothetical protein J6M58_04180 [Clostridium sp.]|nr:hypothetical protein [Clostridium sp.]